MSQHPSRSDASALSEQPDDLDVAGIAELVDGRDPRERITAADQYLGVTGEGGRFTRHRDDGFDARIGDLAHLEFRARAGRIEYGGIEYGKVDGVDRVFEQIAHLRGHGLEPRAAAPSRIE